MPFLGGNYPPFSFSPKPCDAISVCCKLTCDLKGKGCCPSVFEKGMPNT